MIWNHFALKVKLQGSSILHHRVLKVTRKGPANNGEERKYRTQSDRVCRIAETADQIQHRLSMPRTKGRARRTAGSAAEVVLLLTTTDVCEYTPCAHAPTTLVTYVSAKATANQIVALLPFVSLPAQAHPKMQFALSLLDAHCTGKV